MPRHIKNHELWEKAKKNIGRTISLSRFPQKYYAGVTNEYKRLGGKFLKPGTKKKSNQMGLKL